MEGAVGFRLMYFHLSFEFISFGLLLIAFLTCFLKFLRGVGIGISKIVLIYKIWIFSWYSVDGRMTIVLPLSAEVTIASFFLSLAVIVFKVFHSMCVL